MLNKTLSVPLVQYETCVRFACLGYQSYRLQVACNRKSVITIISRDSSVFVSWSRMQVILWNVRRTHVCCFTLREKNTGLTRHGDSKVVIVVTVGISCDFWDIVPLSAVLSSLRLWDVHDDYALQRSAARCECTTAQLIIQGSSFQLVNMLIACQCMSGTWAVAPLLCFSSFFVFFLSRFYTSCVIIFGTGKG